ncbi:MAG: alpha/beta hydrolase [Acidobacteriota bacterium]|nr:alpha/beta hydrolase [Acidobacteriota bacterium]
MPRSTSRTASNKSQSQHLRPASSPPEVVDPIWLLKAVGLALVAALICAYLTLCLLFYQGQWQVVLHPTRTSSGPPSISGIPYELIHFAPDESAVPQLTGWWIPAAPAAPYVQSSILFLPGADGSLANSIPTLATLHKLGINIFAFDYRGYGQSAPAHPNQQKMIRDAESAFLYLATSRSMSPSHIVLYGANIGAPLAVQLASTHPDVPAVILDDPYSDLLPVAEHDPRASILPVRLLFRERFPLAEPLSHLHTPKLLLSRCMSANRIFATAADPKETVQLATDNVSLFSRSVTQFLNQYLPPPSPRPPVTSPAPTP